MVVPELTNVLTLNRVYGLVYEIPKRLQAHVWERSRGYIPMLYVLGPET